uniref:Immunoglobulin-like and fibronectin type III domain-containing protein 1 n=1 Tax=Oryzias melastigma TaxID=30732 RepID=A0A3B3BEC1_ORYME
MWKRGKNSSQSSNRPCFSLVHQYIQRFNEVSGNKTAAIRRRSKTPGVMITQYSASLPEGKSTPDFQCKPVPVTVQEGKLAVFKAVVTGDPKPDVLWRRAKGTITDKEKFQRKYDESTGEHILEIYKVTSAESDTYKCSAVNEYGKAVCTTTLSVIDETTAPADFRKLLKKSKEERADGENDEKFWDALLNAERKDYEQICKENGITDLHLILKKLEEKKRQRGQNKHKDSVIPYDDDDDEAARKYGNNSVRRTQDLRSNGPLQSDSGLYPGLPAAAQINISNQKLSQAGTEEDLLLMEYKLSNVDFVIKIQELNIEEADNALFECVLTHPLPKITWMRKGLALEDGEKYSITVSEHKLIHRLMIRDCCKTDKGIYSAVAGITSCSAWLVVEDHVSGGKKTIRKTTLAGGVQRDLEKVAKEQQLKNQKEMEKILEAIKVKQAAEKVKNGKTPKINGEYCNGTGQHGGTWDRSSEGDGGDGASEDPWCVEDRWRADNPWRADDPWRADNPWRAEEGTKQEKMKNIHKELSDECLDVDEYHSSAMNQREIIQISGSKNCNKSAGRQKKTKRVQWKEPAAGSDMDPNEQASDEGLSDADDNEDAFESESHGYSQQNENTKDTANGQSATSEAHGTPEDIECVSCASTRVRRKKQGSLIQDLVTDPGVHFIWGLSDVDAIINETAELTCKLSSDDWEGTWFRDGKKISSDDIFSITKDGPIHKLVIIKCAEDHSGKYRFEADGRKTEAMVNVKDPPRFNPEDLCAFTEPLAIKVGHNAIFKVQFVGHQPVKIQWFRDGDELQGDTSAKIENSAGHSRLLLSRCQRKDTGEIKIKLKNEHGFTEAVSKLLVLDKPNPPQGPAEVTQSSASCIEFKWRPPKDDGGSPVINYTLERQQVGRNTWKKMGEIAGGPTYRDTDVDRGRKYCYRIRAVTAEGISEAMETDDMQAGTFALPGPPTPPQVVSAFHDCINLSWAPPSNTGGSRILGYVLEKRKKGSNLWAAVNAADELIKGRKYAVRDVVEGMEYEFRVSAVNLSGAGESSNPSEFAFARDPKKPPGKVTSLKVTETSYTNMVLTWTKPEEKPGIQDEAKGYFVEIRKADSLEWSRCNSTPFILTSFNVRGLRSMEMYWVRVIAANDGGEGPPEELPNYVLAMPLPEKLVMSESASKDCDLRCAPTFIVPLKLHTATRGYECYMSCAVKGTPTPHVTWYRNHVSLNTDTNYYISNTCGVCSLAVLSVGPKDVGEYTVIAENSLGRAECSTVLSVRG